MKKQIILFFLISFSFLQFACKKKVKIEVAELKDALEEVQRFYKTFPDSVGCDSTGKNCQYAVGDYHTVYAVHFYKIKDLGESIEEHYPEYDFKQILENFPTGSDGVRIYEAIGKDNKMINYLTYTIKNTDTTRNQESNDMLDKEVYKILNIKFDLRDFKQLRKNKEIKTSHRSCSPDCPEESLLNKEL
jgi:hypothetical protein